MVFNAALALLNTVIWGLLLRDGWRAEQGAEARFLGIDPGQFAFHVVAPASVVGLTLPVALLIVFGRRADLRWVESLGRGVHITTLVALLPYMLVQTGRL